MSDSFAIPAATIRVLFDYEYRSDRVILRPRVPGSMPQDTKNLPIRFGEKHLYLSCHNGGAKIQKVTINGKAMPAGSAASLVLMYDQLPVTAEIEITTEGGWPQESSTAANPAIPALLPNKDTKAPDPADLAESLKKPFAVLSTMNKLLADEPDSDYERAFVATAIESCQVYRIRATMDPDPGHFRPITP